MRFEDILPKSRELRSGVLRSYYSYQFKVKNRMKMTRIPTRGTGEETGVYSQYMRICDDEEAI
jgi:hypothetical protein